MTQEFNAEENVTFLVKFKEKADVQKVAKEAKNKAQKNGLTSFNAELQQRSSVISELKATADISQANVKNFLEEAKQEGVVKDYHSYHIVNAIAVTANKRWLRN